MWKPFDSAPQTGTVILVRWLVPTTDGRGAQAFALWRFEKESGLWQMKPDKKPARGTERLSVNRGPLCYDEQLYPDEWFDFEATGKVLELASRMVETMAPTLAQLKDLEALMGEFHA